MAEKNVKTSEGESTSANSAIPSNEDIIDDLTRDLNSSRIKSEVNESGGECRSSLGMTEEAEGNSNNSGPEDCERSSDSESKQDNSENGSKDDDYIDEVALKDLEVTYTEDDKQRLRAEADKYKTEGNEQYKAGDYEQSARSYTQALRTCPLAFEKDRAIMFSNRAAAKMKLELSKTAIEDCTKAVELDSAYLKAYFRRAQLYEETEKLDEALADYQKILELDPLHRDALYATKRLPEQINERNEKMKTEMLGKLKDLGNLILRPFGLSTDNFQLSQDPNSGGYSVNFRQNAS